jgi:hypothetical protein
MTGPEATQPQGIASNELIPARSRQILGSRYLGSSSCLSQSLAICSPENGALLNPVRPSFPFEDLEADLQITPKIHQHLIQQYVLEINPLYPILDSSLSFLSLESPFVNDMTPSETFILQMMYSISCHWDDALSIKLLGLSDACYARALKHIDTVTANLTHLTLQAISLLALRGLFDPQKGNFGQLIAFASRLVIDIGGQDITAHGQEIRNIYTSIYCMENQFATALDRPQFLPEPVSVAILTTSCNIANCSRHAPWTSTSHAHLNIFALYIAFKRNTEMVPESRPENSCKESLLNS